MTGFERAVFTGPPHERGIAHGERFAESIADNVAVYRRRFDHHGVDPEAAREQASEFVPLIEGEHPDYADEMRGIAEGSGVSLTDIAMLNVRWEVMYTAWKEEAEAHTDADADADTEADRNPGSVPEPGVDGCTSFGVLPAASADGATYVGQNWDWLAPIRDTLFLMELRRDDGPDLLTMTEAGIVGGKCGVNEHGIGIAVNGLISTTDGENPFRTPYHVRFRRVLDADRFDEAIRPLVEADRACSANVVIGHADGEVIDLELAPEAFNAVYPDEDGVLAHSNHFETDAIESLNEARSPSTLYRGPRLRRILAESAGAIDADVLTSALRDHFGRPSSICSHVDESLPAIERGRTNGSFVLDLGARRMLAARGPPCEAEYRAFRLGAG